ncbi:hypothetical protein [Bradyrhizobium sp. AUGA SZCCT0431]|uniref:hypothetical protein n=1 Tax=Bradyrhizobium sp. AUGA SZCCT0431 TaxID=2807674 RepID=UPI001BA90159|nr:hypothetical protein [Bradyrhizobium sp. AUGA SZCCT0431]MBR1146661.1 hypothetical protein [Bradyrhizobium sp. AUGA SZCCT0431]
MPALFYKRDEKKARLAMAKRRYLMLNSRPMTKHTHDYSKPVTEYLSDNAAIFWMVCECGKKILNGCKPTDHE